MNKLPESLQWTHWLYTRLFHNEYLFIDLWSVAHFWSAFGIMVLARFFRIRHPFRVMMISLILYEIAEILFLYLALSIFRPETLRDQGTDLVVGFLGGLTGWYVLRWTHASFPKRPLLVREWIAFYAAVTIAFTWTGFYGYRYNYSWMNSEGLNYWAFMWWIISLMMVMNLHMLFRCRKNLSGILVPCMVYYLSLLVFEFIGYCLMGMKEISKVQGQALCYDLIHGAISLHIFYIIAPLLAIGAFRLAEFLILTNLKRK